VRPCFYLILLVLNITAVDAAPLPVTAAPLQARKDCNKCPFLVSHCKAALSRLREL